VGVHINTQMEMCIDVETVCAAAATVPPIVISGSKEYAFSITKSTSEML